MAESGHIHQINSFGSIKSKKIVRKNSKIPS